MGIITVPDLSIISVNLLPLEDGVINFAADIWNSLDISLRQMTFFAFKCALSKGIF